MTRRISGHSLANQKLVRVWQKICLLGVAKLWTSGVALTIGGVGEDLCATYAWVRHGKYTIDLVKRSLLLHPTEPISHSSVDRQCMLRSYRE